MLRILAGTLMSGVLISGPTTASSFLVIEHSGDISLPSFQVMDERRELAPPVDATTTAAHDAGEPEIIPAPRFVATSRSISVMLPGEAPDGGSIAAIGEPVPEAGETPARQARQSSPMVIRGGLVGEDSPSSPESTQPERPAQAEAERSPARTSSQPAAGRSSSGPSGSGSGPRQPSSQPSQPPPSYESPPARPSAVPL